MAEYLNAKCSICGTKYHVCNDCKNTKSFTPWKMVACSMNCYKIFMALRDYTNGYAAKEETKNILKDSDLSNLETFEENIKASIKNILKERNPKRSRKTVKKTVKAYMKPVTFKADKGNISDNDNE